MIGENKVLLQRVKANLGEAQQGLSDLINEYTRLEKWDLQQQATDWARALGAIKNQLLAPEAEPAGVIQIPGPVRPQPAKLHYFYVDDGTLVLRGPSPKHGFYEHRIPREHYDLVVDRITRLAMAGDVVQPQSLQNREEMPVHEPGEVVRLFEQRGLLVKARKGKYRFKDRHNFQREVRDVWDKLPRTVPGGTPTAPERATSFFPHGQP